jgi:hypothetical protein
LVLLVLLVLLLLLLLLLVLLVLLVLRVLLVLLVLLPLVRRGAPVLPRSVVRRTWIATAVVRVSPHGSAAAAAAAVRWGRTWAPALLLWGRPVAVVPAPLGAAIVRPPGAWAIGSVVGAGGDR